MLRPVKKLSGRMTAVWGVACVALFMMSYSFVIQPSGIPLDSKSMRETTEHKVVDDFLIRLPNGNYSHMKNMVEKKILTEEEIRQEPYVELPIYESE